ncbi:hypothetical protein [Baaleninema sp.]|uniref:hypothetical protein n=1 Tax=Baaleninema sp. TaxID=3101197 RepID=UPI003D013D0E
MKVTNVSLVALLATFPVATAGLAQFHSLINRPNFFERGYEAFEEEIHQLSRVGENPPSLTVSDENLMWQRVLFREGGFSIWIPYGTVVQETETVETEAGILEFDILAMHPESARYVAAYSEPFDFSQLGSDAEVLGKVRDRLLERESDFEMTVDRNLSVNGLTAKDLRFQNEEETISFRLIIESDRLYVLAVSQLNESASLEAVTAFFDSFHKL